ncbi:MAG: hypothetical protein NC938_06060 [Candidatus Omnitrophica bacterium]|nr:hypothetical protein [Candidatus Omnitrophota bacterium]MCM8791241.1 hypothetical protein [Candidatus Omnitrophota bacterium]
MPFGKMFKKCTSCGANWKTRDDFLNDCSLELIGYQANFKSLETGLLLFNHTCGTTLSLPAGTFKDIYKGPIYTERKTGTEDCPGYCLHEEELRRCPEKCECAWVREMIQVIKEAEKTHRARSAQKKG